MTILITGGSGCGKSTFAERVIASNTYKKRYYIATMQVYDEESVRRVARHRAQRQDKGFMTIERQKDLGALELECGCAVLLEDLPNLLANEMFDGGDPERIIPALESLNDRCGLLVLVTNDIFSDGVVYPDMTQEYIRLLSRVNRATAMMADQVIEVVYSIPLYIKGGTSCV